MRTPCSECRGRRHLRRSPAPTDANCALNIPTCAGKNQLADDELQRVLAAYAKLRNPKERAEYDRATGMDARGTRKVQPSVSAGEPGPVDIPIRFVTPKPRNAPEERPLIWVGPLRRHR